MSHAHPTPGERNRFANILDRMRLLGDDFTAHADDRKFLRALAGTPATASDRAEELLADEYCAQLDLPPGTTHQAAARRLLDLLGF